MRFSRRWALSSFLAITTFVSAVLWRVETSSHLFQVTLFWVLPIFMLRAYGWLVSVFDKPWTVRTPEEQARLDALRVTVSIPVWNEDPALLDRCIWALVNQTRPPQRIDVVDDESNRVDYAVLEEFWVGWHGSTEVTWHRQPLNNGKRRAHCHTFKSDTEADVFATVDSDTTVLANGIEEGIKPFLDPEVQSVAGIELGFNASQNFLTLLQNSLQQVAQAVVSASWSVTGHMFTNRGPFALYRGELAREMIPLYYGETFWGRRVILGDDSLMALAGGCRGKAVQQLSAFGLTMWPDNLKWHLRQRLRWARGRTVRNFWRMRYYPVLSYLWLFTVGSIYSFFVGMAALVLLVRDWPQDAGLIVRILLAMIWLSWLAQFRVLCFRRSDETWVDRALVIAIRPIASLWASVVLSRLLRALGMATFLRQGWTTRRQGAEIVLEQQESLLGPERDAELAEELRGRA